MPSQEGQQIAFFESHGSLEPDRAELLLACYSAARGPSRAWRAERGRP